MLIELDREILQKTTDCDKDFQCLSNENQIYCKVSECISNVHFVKCSLENYCYYKLSFGNEKFALVQQEKQFLISTVSNRLGIFVFVAISINI